jgi:hypothetical protein
MMHDKSVKVFAELNFGKWLATLECGHQVVCDKVVTPQLVFSIKCRQCMEDAIIREQGG